MRVRVVTTVLATVTEEWLIEAPSVEAVRDWFDREPEAADVDVIDVRNIGVTDEMDRKVTSIERSSLKLAITDHYWAMRSQP